MKKDWTNAYKHIPVEEKLQYHFPVLWHNLWKKSLLSLFDNWNIGTESSQDPNRLGETIMGQYGCLYGQLTFKGIISPTLPQLNRQ